MNEGVTGPFQESGEPIPQRHELVVCRSRSPSFLLSGGEAAQLAETRNLEADSVTSGVMNEFDEREKLFLNQRGEEDTESVKMVPSFQPEEPNGRVEMVFWSFSVMGTVVDDGKRMTKSKQTHR